MSLTPVRRAVAAYYNQRATRSGTYLAAVQRPRRHRRVRARVPDCLSRLGRRGCATCGDKVEVIALPIDDLLDARHWPNLPGQREALVRGNLLGLQRLGREVQAVQGGCALARRLLGELKLLAFAGPLVIEGGNLCAEGEGTPADLQDGALEPRTATLICRRGEAEEHLRRLLGRREGHLASRQPGGYGDGRPC